MQKNKILKSIIICLIVMLIVFVLLGMNRQVLGKAMGAGALSLLVSCTQGREPKKGEEYTDCKGNKRIQK